MGYREFVDSLGTIWKVWNTAPVAGAVLQAEWKNGWLTFEAMGACPRRLVPVPDHWEQLPADQLERLCALASEVRRTTPGGVILPNDERA